MKTFVVVIATACACGGHGKDAAPARARIMVRETGVGPIDENTFATVEAIGRLLPGYDVQEDATNSLGPPGVRVSADGELQLIVVADDHRKAMLVLATSPRVIAESGWRVGDKLTDVSRLAGCDCLGDGMTCHERGSRIWIVLDRCQFLEQDAVAAGHYDFKAARRLAAGDPAELAKWKGHAIRALRWAPHPPGAHDNSDPPPPPGNDDDPPPPPPPE
jgi:hypothetical protein